MSFQTSKRASLKTYAKIHRFLQILLVVLLCSFAYPSIAQDTPKDDNCSICTSLHSYPQLASLTSDDGLLSQLIFNQLLGTDFNLTSLNWQGLIQNDFEMEQLFLNLANDLDLSSPQAVLQEDITLNQLLTALITVAENEGTILALNKILGANTTTQTFQLGELLDITTIDQSLANINLDFFSFLNSAIQLYNYQNVVKAPIGINIPVVGDVLIQAQVVEPPSIVCAESSTQIFSAGVRLKLDVDIVDVGINSIVPTTPFTSADVQVLLTELELYVDVARGLTTITAVNGIDETVNITATPGLARLFIGSIDDIYFYDRSKDPLVYLNPGIIGSVRIITPLTNVTLDITAKGSADAASTAKDLSNVSVPFNLSLGNSSATLSELVDDLLTDTEINITSNLPILPVVEVVLDIALDNIVGNVSSLLFAQTGVIHNILSYVVDPILSSLGIKIGEVIVAGNNLVETCLDMGDAPNSYSTLFDTDGPRHVIDDLLYLGTMKPGSELDGRPDGNANLELEDDGVSYFPYATTLGEYSVDVTVTNLSLDSAQLVAWIDFNGNGVFENNYERSVVSSEANVKAEYSGVTTLTWINLPLSSDPNLKYSRFRISSDPSFFDLSTIAPSGFAMDGEVEDYYIAQSILPVDFLSFNVNDLGEKIEIVWQVANEINLDYYAIEKSYDGINFRSIHSEEAHVDIKQIQKYEYIDYDDANGNIYYKIRSLDLDGTQNVTNIRSIQRESGFDIIAAPNPIHDLLTLDIFNENKNDVLIEIHNAQHQLIYSNRNHLEKSTLSVDMSNYQSGFYILTTTNHNKVDSKILIKS